MSRLIAFDIEHLKGYPQPEPTAYPLHSGLAGLDRLMGAAGLPAGRITEWVGAESSGKTGALREVVLRARRRGVAVAWVDGPGALLAADWWDAAATAPLWVVRPPVAADAALCTELLLRTRSFGLVVLDGGPPLDAALGVRLQRLAKQASAALVRLRGPGETAGRLVSGRLRFVAEPPEAPADAQAARLPLRWSVNSMRDRGGEPEQAAFVLQEPVALRLDRYPVSPDRPSTRTRAGTRYGR
jgi:hypothetical protein